MFTQLAAVNQADPNGILTGRLDLQRAGIFGLSLGGADSAEACRQEPRWRACLVMDVFMGSAASSMPTRWRFSIGI